MKDQIAFFVWNPETRRFQVEVGSYIVAELRTLAEVKAFCVMHNNRLLGGELCS